MKETGRTAPISFPPFAFGAFHSESFSDTRRRDAEQIRSLLEKGEPAAVFAEPGMGRSDMVRSLAESLTDDETILLEVSVSKCFDVADFFERLTNRLLSAVTSSDAEFSLLAETLLREAPHTLVRDAEGEPVIRLERSEWMRQILFLANLPEIAAEKLKLGLLIVIYDIEHLAAFDGGLAALGMILDAFSSGSRIRFAVTGTETTDLKPAEALLASCCRIVRLDRIPREEWIRFIVETFAVEAKRIDEAAAGAIVQAVNGLSAYVLELAWHTWIATDHDVGSEEIERGMAMLLNSHAPEFIVMMRDMSDEERFLLISLVMGKKANASKSTIRSLSSLGLLRIVNGQPVLHDPVLARWIAGRYLPAKAMSKPFF